MKKFLPLMLCGVLLLLLTACVTRAEIGSDDDYNTNYYTDTNYPEEYPQEGATSALPDVAARPAAIALEYIENFMRGDSVRAFEMQNQVMRDAFTPESIYALRDQFFMAYGSVQSVELLRVHHLQGYLGGSFDIGVMHTTGLYTIRVHLITQGLVSGFELLGFEFIPLLPGADANYYAEAIIVGEGTPWPLDGMLTIPKDASTDNPVPAIVLVHGSGSIAGDMDSSLFDNRPFHDIADYLSSHGIAVIRYHKRPFVHGAEMLQAHGSDFTVWEETVEDAVLAADILRNDPRIDSDRIFMLGLSLGGMLAPRIHVSGGDFAGIVVFASSPQTLTDIMIEQTLAMIESSDDEDMIALLQVQLMSLVPLFEMLDDMDAEMAQSIPMGGGTTLYYFQDMNRYAFAGLAEDIHIPFLIQLGTHDFQVLYTSAMPLFEEIFEGRDNVAINLYQGLNHILMPSIATSIDDIFADYAIPGNVYPQVLRDLAEWILAYAPPVYTAAETPDEPYVESCVASYDEVCDEIYDEVHDDIYDETYDEAHDDIYDETYDELYDASYDELLVEVYAKTPEVPLLWRVSDGSGNYVYLFASFPFADENLLPLPAFIMDALGRSDHIAVEMNILEIPRNPEATIALWQNTMMNSSGRTLSMYLDDELLSRIEYVFAPHDAPLSSLDLFHPAGIYERLSVIALMESDMLAPLVYAMLLTEAEELGIEIIEISSLEASLNILQSLSLPLIIHQIEFLLDTQAVVDTYRNLYAAWLRGDWYVLRENTHGACECDDCLNLPIEVLAELIAIQNDRVVLMMDALTGFLAEGQSVFVSVDYALVTTIDGVIDRLVELGYSVKRVVE